jgi:hypothetical protein
MPGVSYAATSSFVVVVCGGGVADADAPFRSLAAARAAAVASDPAAPGFVVSVSRRRGADADVGVRGNAEPDGERDLTPAADARRCAFAMSVNARRAAAPFGDLEGVAAALALATAPARRRGGGTRASGDGKRFHDMKEKVPSRRARGRDPASPRRRGGERRRRADAPAFSMSTREVAPTSSADARRAARSRVSSVFVFVVVSRRVTAVVVVATKVPGE